MSALPDRPMRSQLGRARGAGTSHTGSGIWWAERVTSLALAPLTAWFVISVLRLLGLPQAAVWHWASHPANTVLLLALVILTFHHMYLGLRVVLEDYVHSEGRRMIALLATQAACGLLALACILATLSLAGFRA